MARLFRMVLAGAGGVGLALGVSLALHAEPQQAPVSLGITGSAATAPVKLEPFANLPEPKPRTPSATARIHPGTDGLALPDPGVAGGRLTIAILGDFAPGDDATRERFLAQAVAQLNILRPELVLSVGNLVPGMTRDGARYIRQIQRMREALDRLRMPWYPCAGETDVVGGVRVPPPPSGQDRRFEELYRRYVGPLYYSLDAGELHAIVLDSEEGLGKGNTISDAQLRWLKDDLNRTFARSTASGAPRTQWVVVLLHRPLWRQELQGSNWQRVHELLVDFNRRPIVSVEGMSSGADGRGPRVAAVFAGGERAYSMEPTSDGIHYYVLGPTGAMPKSGEDAAEALRHVTLVKFEAPSGGAGGGSGGGETSAVIHPVLIPLEAWSSGTTAAGAGGGGGPILPDDIITARQRDTLDLIASWGNDVIGIDGIVDDHGEPLTGKPLVLRLKNPLRDPLDVQMQLVSTPAYEVPWELFGPPPAARLAPGAADGIEFAIHRPDEAGRAHDNRPQANITVRWRDPGGRLHALTLQRRITVAPTLELPVSPRPLSLDGDTGWSAAATCRGYSWAPRGDEPSRRDPEFQLAVDGDQLFVRARIEDAVPSFWSDMKLDPALGSTASDAVTIAWAKGPESARIVQRIWALPFAPGGAQLWTNTGIGDKQSELLRLDPKWAVKTALKREQDGYTLTLALPRNLVFEDVPIETMSPSQPRTLAAALVNLSVHNNDDTARTWTKSWAREEEGPAAWGRIKISQ